MLLAAKQKGVYSMKKNRLISLLTAAAMAISLFCSFSLSASAVSGSGTESDPYLISNADDFALIQDCPTASFRLTNNIVLNKNYTSTCTFSGTLDGDGYLVVGVNGASPFINNGTIKNLIVEVGDMSSSFISTNNGTIENSGILDGEVSAYGGLGATFVKTNNGTVKNCFSTTQLTVTGMYASGNMGGFIGYNAGTVENCVYMGHIYLKGTTTNGAALNGYVSPFVGGNKEASSSYLDDGGKVISCYYDKDETSSAEKSSGGASGKTSSGLKMQAVYSGWDFDEVWAIDPSKNDGYPYLQIDRRFGGKTETTPEPTETAKPADGAVVEVSASSVSPGGTTEVTVSLSGCKGFSNLGIQIGYDSNALTLISAENNSSVGATYTAAQQITASPYNMSWNSATSNNTFNGALATLTFKAKDNAAEGKYPITVSYYTGRDGDYIDGESVNYDIDHKPLNLSYTDGAITVSEHIPGDINGDGTVSDWDGTLLLRYLAGWEDLDIDASALDVSGDGAVNDWDGTLLLRYLAGWDVEIH